MRKKQREKGRKKDGRVSKESNKTNGKGVRRKFVVTDSKLRHVCHIEEDGTYRAHGVQAYVTDKK
jgi:hypothetical protein